MKSKIKKYVKKLLKKIMFYIYQIGMRCENKCKLSSEKANEILKVHSTNPNSSPICKNIIEKEQIDLSIIVPVYNVEMYIEECLKSILEQKTKYIYKLIIVNDGSTDNSLEKIKAYSSFSEVTVIDQKNQGVSAARNRGLQNINSRYVMFVDSDDYLLENAVENLLNIAYEKNADIVQGSFLYIEDSTNNIIDKKIYKNVDGVPSNGVIDGMPWGKVYKSHLFEKVCFPIGYWYEDSIITSIITHLSESIITSSELVYGYRQRKSSITKVALSNPKCIDTFWMTKCVLEARKELNLFTDNAFYEHLIRQIVLNYKRTINQPESVKQSIFVLTKDILTEEYKKEFILKDRRYLEIDNAFKNRDYGKYCYLCKYVM